MGDKCKVITGHIYRLSSSKNQNSVALSSTKMEYISVNEDTREVV